MAVRKVIRAANEIALIRDGDMLGCSGYGGNGVHEQLLAGLAGRFVETGQSRGLGLNLIGLECLLGRVIGGHFGLVLAIEKLVVDGLILAYDLPKDE